MSFSTPPRWNLSPVQCRALFLGVLVLGAGLRLYNLGEPSLWYDEACLFETAHTFDLRCTFMDPAENMDPPLMLAAARLWEYPARAAGLDPLSKTYDFYLRLFPCFLGILSIGLVAGVCRAWTGDSTLAVFAAFLYAISPFQIYYAQEFRSYAVTVPLALAGLIALRGALAENRLRWWLALVAVEVLLVYNHFFNFSLIFSINVFFVIYFALETRLRNRALLAKWTASQAAVVVLLLPALHMMRVADKIFMNLKYPFYPPPEWKTGLITFKAFFAGYAPSVLAYQMLFVTAAVLAAIGAASFARRRQWPPLFLFGLLLALPIAASIFVWQHRDFPMYAHRLYVVSGVMAAVFAANGLRALPFRKLAWGSGAVMLVFTSVCLADHYALRLHPFIMHRLAVWDKVQIREAADYIKQHRLPQDGIGHVSHFTHLPFNHYLGREGQFSVAVTQFEIDDFVASQGNEPLFRNLNLVPSLVTEEEQQINRLWFVESCGITFNFPNRGDPIREWLNARYVILERVEFDGLVLTLYDADPAKRRQVFAERRTDDGTSPLPVYRTRDKQTFMPAVTHKSGVRASSNEPWEVRLVEKEGGQIEACISSAVRRELDYQLVQASLLIPPLAFQFEDYHSDLWRQIARPVRENLALHYANAVSLLAYMQQDGPKQAFVYRNIELDAGAYDMYAMMLIDPDNANVTRGDAFFYVDGAKIGAVRGNEPGSKPGWQWRRVGAFRSDGAPARMTVVARNPEQRVARVDLGRVAFVPSGERAVDSAGRLTVEPGVPASVPVGPAPAEGQRVVLFEAVDQTRHDVRSLRFILTPQK